VTLALELGTKKQGLFDSMATRYNILCRGRKIYTMLTEEEYFDTMDDLSAEFYQTGHPHPSEIETEFIEVTENG
jgi:hypothetical protein